MKNSLLKLLPLLLAVLMTFALALPALAEDDDSVAATGTDAAESVVESLAETAESTVESLAETAESAAESIADAAQSAAETVSTAESTDDSAPSSGSSNSNLPRWITLAVVVILIVAAVILARTNTKLGQKLAKFWRDYKSEIQKISWYSPKETLKATGVVLVVLIGLAAAIGILDLLFALGIKGLANLF